MTPSRGSCPTSFGTSSNGDLVIPSGMRLSMTRDYIFEVLTVQAGGLIQTNGFNLFINRFLILNGTTQNNGLMAIPWARVRGWRWRGGGSTFRKRFCGQYERGW